jgi:hypothetical protein
MTVISSTGAKLGPDESGSVPNENPENPDLGGRGLR